MQRKIINSSVVPYIYKIEDKEGETKKSSMAKRKEGEKLKDIHLNANMKEDIIKATEVKQKGIKITMEEKVLKAKSDYAADDFSLKAKGDRKVTKM